MLPTVTIIAINLGYVVAGAITAEVVFNWPGLGTLDRRRPDLARLSGPPGRSSCCSRDGRLANLAADLIYGFLDPRVRT